MEIILFQWILSGLKLEVIMQIDKPIFIIGAGRSGTTILYKILSLHPEVCFFSNYTDRYPRFHRLASLHKILDFPLIGDVAKRDILQYRPKKITIVPNEGDNIYHSYCGFEHARKSTENDLTDEMEFRLKKVIEDHLNYTGKKRFLNKQTSNVQRIQLINKMFPDAYYIHLIRDGRAVANSLIHTSWWNHTDIWWFGGRPDSWAENGREPIELCASHWQRGVSEIWDNRHLFNGRYLEVRYEELLKDTPGTIAEIANFCDLDEAQSFIKRIPQNLPNMNNKWKEQLTEEQKRVLNSCIAEFLHQLGYSGQ